MDNYTDDEWQKVVEAPLIVGLAISAADPSSVIGAIQESIESAKFMARAQADDTSSPLISKLVEDYRDGAVRQKVRGTITELSRGRAAGDIMAAAIARLRETAGIVRQKSPGEAEPFLLWLESLSKSVAEAGTEGGFLGFGGEKVSQKERDALAEISSALRAANV